MSLSGLLLAILAVNFYPQQSMTWAFEILRTRFERDETAPLRVVRGARPARFEIALAAAMMNEFVTRGSRSFTSGGCVAAPAADAGIRADIDGAAVCGPEEEPAGRTRLWRVRLK